ncbi:MAG: 2-hydroxychromene-2-carboxylate isomerase [Rhodobiaceae bacterium]|nr:2-hydroxychromene-2-carboxylate isomerase [Rhodobiaceae bacterium]
MVKFEFFFDISSPWTYLAFSRVEALAKRCGVEIDFKPILVGGVFNAVNESVYEARSKPHPIKGRYYLKDLQDWARFCGVTIGQPKVFPLPAAGLMRAALVAQDQGKLSEFSHAAFYAYWGELKDISQPEEMMALCQQVGMEGAAVLEAIQSDAVKARLRANTQDVIDRGGFGSPTMYVNETDMYFGNDRLELVEAALKEAAGN